MAMRVQLPGGIEKAGRRFRGVLFRPLTGHVEIAVANRDLFAVSRPSWVSSVLAAAVSDIGELPMCPELADELSVQDRIFLLLQLGIRLYGDDLWISPTCAHCCERFDLYLKRSAFPVREAGATYPETTVEIMGVPVVMRAPIGKDQQWISDCRPAASASDLLSRCIVTVAGEPPTGNFVSGLDNASLKQLESAVEAMGPEVTCALRVPCPECGATQPIQVDPCRMDGLTGDLDDEIHTLAFYYHWSESEILGITRDRRLRYLSRIDRELGRHD